jgi:hypothetical protein
MPEEIEVTAVAVREPQAAALFAGKPEDVIKSATLAATALKDVVRRQGLISNISGKEYPRCEAWTLLGSMVGVFPVLCWTKAVVDGWEARVEARTISGAVVGAAEAQCLHSEKNWNNREDFAVRSMAQTRATAKALRMPLGFVMTLAGYEATPAEEMSFDRSGEVVPPPQKPTPTINVRPTQPQAQETGDWRNFRVPFGKHAGKQLGELGDKSVGWFIDNFAVESSFKCKDGMIHNKRPETIAKDQLFRDALDACRQEMMDNAKNMKATVEAGMGEHQDDSDKIPF